MDFSCSAVIEENLLLIGNEVMALKGVARDGGARNG